MLEIKSNKIEDQKSTNCLRRSSRLHRQNQTGAQSPRTPNPAERKRRLPDSSSSPISKIKKTGRGVLENGTRRESDSDSEKSRIRFRRSARVKNRTGFSCPDLGKSNVKEKRQRGGSVSGCRFVKGSEKSSQGSRSSRRRNGGANVGESKEALYPRKEEVIEKMVTRNSVRRNKIVRVCDSDSEEDSGEWQPDSGESAATVSKNAGKIKKRVTRYPGKTDMKKANNVPNTRRRKEAILDDVEPKGGDELSRKDMTGKDVQDCGVMNRNGEQNCTRKTQMGEKRKRDGVEEECENAQGWTKEQEVSLQRAYFTAKPTPQFWKKVARMVPGKSAEECFDKIHSDHLTPPQPRTRSRARIKEPSPLSFSATTLLSPAERKTKRLGSKRRILLAQKTVRQILQKQQKEDQDYSADLFAVLEPTINPSPVNLEEGPAFASPAPSKTLSFLTACRPVSSSPLQGKKHLSRLNGSKKAGFISPPVLKQIKNKALHEKYIDQLHCRDAKRKAEALRISRNIKGQIDEKMNCLNQDLVKAAKDALVSDAQDAISMFRSLQCRTDDDSDSRSDDGGDGEEEEDNEDGLS